MEYNVDYFIKKFEAIPEKYWAGKKFIKPRSLFSPDRYCAQGFCMPFWMIQKIKSMTSPFEVKVSDPTLLEWMSLVLTFSDSVNDGRNIVAGINNGTDPNYQQPTPKARILAALYDIKAKQRPYQNSVSRSLAEQALKDTGDSRQDMKPERKEVLQ